MARKAAKTAKQGFFDFKTLSAFASLRETCFLILT